MSDSLYLDDSIELNDLIKGSRFLQNDFNLALVKWKRPKNIVDNAKVFNEQSIALPVQGFLGNCWLVSICSLLKTQHQLKVIFKKYIAEFENDSYIGKWNIWLFDTNCNKWVCITIDDRLPTINNKLIFGCCDDPNQFWFPILEKACAKFYGCYSALDSGQASEGFLLVTSGYCWRKYLADDTKNFHASTLKKQITKSLTLPDSMLIVVAVVSDVSVSKANDSQCGYDSFVPFHYYTVIGFDEDMSNVSLRSVCLKNNQVKSEIMSIPLQTLASSNATFTFCTTSLSPVFGVGLGTIHEKSIKSSWKAGLNSGGRYGLSSYPANPQFLLEFDLPGFVHVALIQNNNRSHPKRKESQQAIGIHAWKMSQNIRKPLKGLSFKSNSADFVTEPIYQYISDVSLFGSLTEAEKCLLVIPSSYARDVNCEFLFRFCSSSFFTVKQLNP